MFYINIYFVFILGTIDYNFLCFKQAIQEVFEVRNKASQPPLPSNNTHHANHTGSAGAGSSGVGQAEARGVEQS
jgi:hypothetical protein